MIKKIFVGAFAVLMISVLGLELLTVGKVSSAELKMGNSAIHVKLEGTSYDVSSTHVLDWVKSCADAVQAYYGRFPVSALDLNIRSYPGSSVRNGVTYPAPSGGLIKISVGQFVSQQQLRDDWMLTHEMVHLAFPSVDPSQHWIEEGLATYVESWARVHIGELKPGRVWADFVRDMPQGQPEAGDQGLDRTPTWGRTYWGGALFCLVADVEIRKRTQNRKGLIDALRAINARTNISEDANLRSVLKMGDAATGVTVLSDLYEKWRANPVVVDLDGLWKDLGVKRVGRETVFDDTAPLAATRRAIERRLPSEFSDQPNGVQRRDHMPS